MVSHLPKVVLDTNVLVSALRSRKGASFQIVERVGKGFFLPCVSTPLVLEYEDVLLRAAPELGYTAEDVQNFVDFIVESSEQVKSHYYWRPFLSDPGDEHVLELAVAAGAYGIITYNKRDFAGVEDRFNIKIINAHELLQKLEIKL
jgi:putative PIN family toxin of toxin-antitoxin system